MLGFLRQASLPDGRINNGFSIGGITINCGIGNFVLEPYFQHSRQKTISQGIYEIQSKIASSLTSVGTFKGNVATIEPSTVSEIASLKNNIIEVSTNNSTVSPIAIYKSATEEAASHQSVLQIASEPSAVISPTVVPLY